MTPSLTLQQTNQHLPAFLPVGLFFDLIQGFHHILASAEPHDKSPPSS
jgi:hypothetical protein